MAVAGWIHISGGNHFSLCLVSALGFSLRRFRSGDCWNEWIIERNKSQVIRVEGRTTPANQGKTTVQAVTHLTIVFLIAWVLCFWPARLVRPEHGVWWMSVAAICCLVPGWIVVLLERLAIFRGDIKLILGQMCVRFFAVLITGVVVKWREPQFGLLDFYGWLIVFYILAMVMEVILLREKFSKQSSTDTDRALNP